MQSCPNLFFGLWFSLGWSVDDETTHQREQKTTNHHTHTTDDNERIPKHYSRNSIKWFQCFFWSGSGTIGFNPVECVSHNHHDHHHHYDYNEYYQRHQEQQERGHERRCIDGQPKQGGCTVTRRMEGDRRSQFGQDVLLSPRHAQNDVEATDILDHTVHHCRKNQNQ